MIYLGDFLEDATVTFPFTTNAADGGRESFSASLEEADIVILKDGVAMTLDASTITISTDLGSRTGVHVVSVDMSNDADFTTGADYAAVLYASDETVDSQAPAGVLATWSCQNRTVNLDRWKGSTPADLADTNKVQVSVAHYTVGAAQSGDSYERLGAPAGASVSADVAAVKSETATIVADTNELQSDWANGGRLDLILDSRASQSTADAIEAGTQDLQTQIGTAGAGLTDIPWNADWDAEVQSEVLDALVDQGLAAVHTGTAQGGDTVPGGTITLDNGASSVDDFYNGTFVVPLSGTGAGQAPRIIRDYTGSTRVASVVPNWTTAPDNTTTFAILGVPSYADLRLISGSNISTGTAQLGVNVAGFNFDVISSNALAESAITEIQSGLSTLTQSGVRTAVGLASANLDTQLGDIPTNSELATAIITGLTTALDDGYRGTGETGSVRDLLYEIMAGVLDHSISGTTKTSRKIDGTTAKTYTLDSSSSPTSITEAT